MSDIADQLFRASGDIRYVAVYQGGEPQLRVRPDVESPSSSESDRYEELIVNPALLTLTRQRGDIDCGGLEYLIVGYGKFFQLVYPIHGGHISVAVERTGDPLAELERVREVVEDMGLG